MIFAAGELLPQEKLPALLDALENRLNETLAGPPLKQEVVLSALEDLGRALEEGELDPLLLQYAPPGARQELEEVKWMLRRETLERRLELELGEMRPGTQLPRPFGWTLVNPLGVLLHVTAGNQLGLPLFSAAEGLLTGNLNLVKLPRRDGGLSIAALKVLTHREPRLAPYLYAFEVSSGDTPTLKKLATLADGIVTWGGDGAIAGLRQMAPPGCRLVEWGHRLSFAYLTKWRGQEAVLSALARHIVRTGGLLCSSCQVIYLDTDSLEEGAAFCEAFAPLLEEAAKARSRDQAAQAALNTQTYRLERWADGAQDRAWFGPGCSLTLGRDRELELSPLYGNVRVKCLPRRELLPTLRRQKGRLQTAGLLCGREERRELTQQLARAGVTKIIPAGELSRTLPEENHDGEYPLRRYLRLVDVEIPLETPPERGRNEEQTRWN